MSLQNLFAIIADGIEIDMVAADSEKDARRYWLEDNCFESVEHAKRELPARTITAERIERVAHQCRCRS